MLRGCDSNLRHQQPGQREFRGDCSTRPRARSRRRRVDEIRRLSQAATRAYTMPIASRTCRFWRDMIDGDVPALNASRFFHRAPMSTIRSDTQRAIGISLAGAGRHAAPRPAYVCRRSFGRRAFSLCRYLIRAFRFSAIFMRIDKMSRRRMPSAMPSFAATRAATSRPPRKRAPGQFSRSALHLSPRARVASPPAICRPVLAHGGRRSAGSPLLCRQADIDWLHLTPMARRRRVGDASLSSRLRLGDRSCRECRSSSYQQRRLRVWLEP